MNSRQRVLAAINHSQPDRTPIDLGGSLVSGIMASALVDLRKHLGLDHSQVKVYDCYQMLGEVTLDLVEKFQIDLLPVEPEAIAFGHLRRQDFKPWTLFSGKQVLVPGAFEVDVSESGDWLLYDPSDPSKKTLARMPEDGFYFDKLEDLQWDPEFIPPSIESLEKSNWRRLDAETLSFLQAKAEFLRSTTDKALVLTNWGDAPLGPPSIGSIPNWMTLLVSDKEYVQALFDLADEIAIDNLKQYWNALGDKIDIINLDGYDFGAQNRELFSPAIFKQYFEPSYRAQCDWIHEHTPWKTAKHCCGSIPNLIEPMIRSGIDVLNPVQTTAADMSPEWLKATFGQRITFWGGGVDTQNILPFGTPEEVYEHVAQRTQLLMPGGGFIWAPIHNIQANVPPENIVAAIQAVQDFGIYPK